MISSRHWTGTSYEIDIVQENQELINKLKDINIGTVDEETKKYIIYNDRRDLIFFPENFIEKTTFFHDYIDYFCGKNFMEDINVFGLNEQFWKENYSEEVEKYKTITKHNIIQLNPTFKNISIKLLSDLQNQNSKIRFVTMIYILLMLSTNTEYDSSTIFRFSIQREERIVSKDVNFGEVDDTEYDLLISIYNWILFEEGSVYAYKQKLEIIREQLLRLDYQLSNQILSSAKSIFQRVIQQETDKYFEEVGNLKDDFFKLIGRENDLYQSLHVKILGWLSALGILIFNEVKDYSGHDLYIDLFFKNSSKVIILLVLLMIAIASIMITYIIEITALKKEYNKIRQFYTEWLTFDKADFDSRISAPAVDWRYIVLFGILLSVLLWRISV